MAVQFRETAAVRGWHLPALAVMANHVHLVVVAGEALPTGKVIGDFKAYSTRRLNAEFGRRGRWWTERGSGRLLPDDRAVGRAVAYVLSQERPLVVWAAG